MTCYEKRILAKSKQWYLSRFTGSCLVKCWDATKTDITKHHGCIEYRGNGSKSVHRELLYPYDCREYFGHCPLPEGLIYVEKTTKGWSEQAIDLAFSD